MKQSVLPVFILAGVVLSGCAELSSGAKAPAVSGPAPVTALPQKIAPTAGARSAAAFDRTTAEQKAAALAAPAGGAELGRVTVSLGSPVEQGFWLRSALVTAPRPGTVKLASGKTAQVDLLPLAGGGPQLSLAAYRALGLGLTDLPSVTVLGR